MEYRAVGNLCAVDLNSLQLPLSNSEALEVLRRKGIAPIDVDILSVARAQIGVSRYKRSAPIRNAPTIFDCSSFIKWLYGKRGIWLPRLSPQQKEVGEEIDKNNLIAGDVVFTPGYICYRPIGIGHVGIVTSDQSVIHATKNVGIEEIPLDQFTQNGALFRGACRYIPKDANLYTFQIPPSMCIETADDIRWLVLQSLDWK